MQTLDLIKQELARRINIYEELSEDGKQETLYIGSVNEDRDLLNFINTLPEEEYIEKKGYVTPTMVTNYASSRFSIDISLTQEEQKKLSIVPFDMEQEVTIKIPIES